MRKVSLLILLLISALLVGFTTADETANILDLTVADIDGNDVELAKYKGNVLLVVNVASKCGLTPQYEDLVKLHEKYAEKGLRILAFPANNFRGQEPGSNAEIKEFCSLNYGVEFDLFAKISVAGEDKAKLYKLLTEENGAFNGEIKWNFTKFLVDREGNVVARFEPRTKPLADEVVSAIKANLTD